MIGLGLSGVLDWGATNRYNYLPIGELLVPGRLSVLDVSETDDRSRNICIAYVLQGLFDQVIKTSVEEVVTGRSYKRPPVLVVLEEVHTFVSKLAPHACGPCSISCRSSAVGAVSGAWASP
jgi:hypothetical protein